MGHLLIKVQGLIHANLYLAVTAVVIVICYFKLPDTTGMTLEEIEDLYRPKNCQKQIIDMNVAIMEITAPKKTGN